MANSVHRRGLLTGALGVAGAALSGAALAQSLPGVPSLPGTRAPVPTTPAPTQGGSMGGGRGYNGSTRGTLRTAQGAAIATSISWSGDSRNLTVTSVSNNILATQQQDAYDGGRSALSRNTGLSLPAPAPSTTAGQVGAAGSMIGGTAGRIAGQAGSAAEAAKTGTCACGRTSASGNGYVGGATAYITVAQELSNGQIRQTVQISNYTGVFNDNTARALFQ
ncbi:MAG: hypothetical protein IPK81_23765 [Rhodospirillales bacterium]|nr:MAG: hypothetical protein IPK81_23765 [Rhodospirillales bacterium]